MAQEIQRQLEECEVKTRELEERGVATEKALRGEAVSSPPLSPFLVSSWLFLNSVSPSFNSLSLFLSPVLTVSLS